MTRHLPGPALVLLLVSATAGGDEGPVLADRVEAVEAGYQSLGTGRYRLGVAQARQDENGRCVFLEERKEEYS